MVEGGAQVMESFLTEGYGDEMHLIRSPMEVGAQGVGVNLDLLGFALKEKRELGKDILEIYQRKA